MAAAPQSQIIQFWATCPFCPSNAHGAVFPVSIRVTFEVNWKGCDVKAKGERIGDPVGQHMHARHPNQIDTVLIDMLAEVLR